MLVKLETSIPQNTEEKLDHNKAIDQLTSILSQQLQEQDPEGLPRVGADTPPPRVTKRTRTTDPTDPDTV